MFMDLKLMVQTPVLFMKSDVADSFVVSGIVPMALLGKDILPEPSLSGPSNELAESA